MKEVGILSRFTEDEMEARGYMVSAVAQPKTSRARSHTWTVHSSLEGRMVGAETNALAHLLAGMP